VTWARARPTSLLEATYASPAEWYLVYSDFQAPHWFARFLKPGFQHVTAIRRDGRLWIEVNLNVSYADVNVVRSDTCLDELHPSCVIQRVLAYRPMTRFRYPWIVGAVTCVEFCKALLGIPDFALWTPYQLYRYIEARKGVLTWDQRQNLRSLPPKRSSCNSARPRS